MLYDPQWKRYSNIETPYDRIREMIMNQKAFAINELRTDGLHKDNTTLPTVLPLWIKEGYKIDGEIIVFIGRDGNYKNIITGTRSYRYKVDNDTFVLFYIDSNKL